MIFYSVSTRSHDHTTESPHVHFVWRGGVGPLDLPTLLKAERMIDSKKSYYSSTLEEGLVVSGK